MKSDYKTPEFLAKNPVGYLPFLEDGDFSLAESAAIAEYGEFMFCTIVLRSQCVLVAEEQEAEASRGHVHPPPFMMIYITSVIPVLMTLCREKREWYRNI